MKNIDVFRRDFFLFLQDVFGFVCASDGLLSTFCLLVLGVLSCRGTEPNMVEHLMICAFLQGLALITVARFSKR